MNRSPSSKNWSGGVLLLFFVCLGATSAAAGMRSNIDDASLLPLGRPLAHGTRVTVPRIPLVDGEPKTLELEELDVWAPNAEIVLFDAQGKTTTLPRPSVRYFRGTVAGDPDSMVFVALGRGVTGFVITKDRKFVLSSRPRPHLRDRQAVADADVSIEEVSPQDEVVPAEGGFTCDVEQQTYGRVPPAIHATSDAARQPASNGLDSSTATYTLNLAIDSVASLYTAFNSNASNVTTWIGNLIAATSIIYQRDLKTNLLIAYAGVNNSAYTVDPGTTGIWNGASTTLTTAHALAQLADTWHLSPPSSVAHSAVVLLSGKSKTSGIAWVQQACSPDFLCDSTCGPLFDGHYGGAYAYCGGVGKVVDTGTIPDPNATNGGVQYELPASNFWSLLETAHELGHVAGSVHTHCIPIVSSADMALAPGRTYVDQCFTGECYSGPTSVPTEKGTIMSYCHNVNPGFAANSRYLFGKSGEVSHLVTDAMLAFIDGQTPHPTVISAPMSISGSNSGTASIANLGAGYSYAWTVVNGAITAGQGTSSVTFTGSADPITVKLVVTNAQSCSVSDSVSVGYGSGLPAPTAVLATATTSTSVSISWTASAGAASYEVARSADGTSYTIVGSPMASPYVDNGATASAPVVNTAYLYKVRAVDGSGNRSVYSNVDLATTVLFTDDPLVAGTTVVKALHLTQLRTAVLAVRTLANGGGFTFTDPTVNSALQIKAIHLTELRTVLDAARSALNLSALTYTDPTLMTTVTPIKAAHFQELRNGVK
jgi:hypothetical protein